MVSSSIINKRYNSNEEVIQVKISIYAMQNCSSNCIIRVGFSTQLEDTILKKSSLCYAPLRSLINRVALTDFVLSCIIIKQLGFIFHFYTKSLFILWSLLIVSFAYGNDYKIIRINLQYNNEVFKFD